MTAIALTIGLAAFAVIFLLSDESKPKHPKT